MNTSGLVTKAHSGFFTVVCDDGQTRVCKAAGRLTKTKHKEDALAVGDRVTVELVLSEDWVTGRIVEVAPRKRVLARRDPVIDANGREIRQVIVANLDLVVFVCACAEPEFHSRMLDRYLVGAEAQKLPIVICVTKVDLVGIEAARAMFADYERIGYKIIYTQRSMPNDQSPNYSITQSLISPQDDGVDELRAMLHGKISVLTGKSGVGKSSLMNRLKPGLGQEVGAVSESLQKGKHTTVAPQLFALDSESWLADTPGLRAYAIWDVHAEELDAYYPEITPFIRDCEYSNCTHINEPGCAVIKAVQRGEISAARHDSYCRLRTELARQKRW